MSLFFRRYYNFFVEMLNEMHESGNYSHNEVVEFGLMLTDQIQKHEPKFNMDKFEKALDFKLEYQNE